MNSPTLKAIMSHWTGELPGDSGAIDLPFDVESFCAENDLLFAENSRRLSLIKELCEEAFEAGHTDNYDLNCSCLLCRTLAVIDSGRQEQNDG